MSARALRRRGAVVAGALVLLAAVAHAEVGGQTPREAVDGFQEASGAGDWDRAARYLDLTRLPAARRETEGRELARKLAVALDRTGALAPETLSDQPEGRSDDGLAAEIERAATVPTRRGPVQILLHRRSGATEPPAWQFTPRTVAQIPTLYDEFGDGWLGDVLPPVLLETRVLTLALWQWIALVALILLAWMVSWAATAMAARILRPIVARTRTGLDEQLLAAARGPFRVGIALLLLMAAIAALGLPAAARSLLESVGKAGTILVITWLVARAVDISARLGGERLLGSGKTSAASMLPVGSKAAKAVLVGLALLAAAQNVGINVTGILAGLGIGGLALALAAQKTLENIFGGVTLIMDQPVRVGDFCRFGDRIGTVEEVGLRSTRIRTLDRTVVSVPNAEFVSLHLENFTRRDRIWLSTTLGLRYETTPDQLRHVMIEIRRMLRAHPRVDPDPARVRFVGFGAYSLDLEIFAYVLTTDYGEFLSIREDIYLRVMDIVDASGTGFAFPSQTTYLGQDEGLDREKSGRAEAQVRAWRERGELDVPEIPAGLDRP